MNLNFYSAKGYESKLCFRVPGKQSQSNPISKGAFILFCGVLLRTGILKVIAHLIENIELGKVYYRY